MITFLEYYNILVEGVLDSVPRNLLKMETSYENFPIKAPYGFWVDRSGNWISVPYIGHAKIGEEILKTANEYLTKEGKDKIDTFYVYKILYTEGWMRVQNTTNATYYELKPRGRRPTSPQLKFLKMCEGVYDVEIESEIF